MSTAVPGRRVLVVTNMWPGDEADYTGIFVKQQVASLREAAPDWTFDVLRIAGERGRADYLAAVPRVRRALRAGYDLVHAHYGLTGATVALARPSSPLVVTLHGNDVNWDWQRVISRLGARRAARVIAVSDQLRDRFGREDATVLPCGVPTVTFQLLDRGEARRRLGLPADAGVVLFPAHPHNPVKDYPLFRAAVDALASRTDRPLVERVLGSVPPSDVPLEMAAADAVVLTSTAEGSPMVVKEALACGTPVVSVDVGDVRHVLEGVPGCAVVERNATALSGALARILEAPGKPDARRRRRARVSELGLDAASVARELLDVYEAVITRRERGPRAGAPTG